MKFKQPQHLYTAILVLRGCLESLGHLATYQNDVPLPVQKTIEGFQGATGLVQNDIAAICKLNKRFQWHCVTCKYQEPSVLNSDTECRPQKRQKPPICDSMYCLNTLCLMRESHAIYLLGRMTMKQGDVCLTLQSPQSLTGCQYGSSYI